MIPKEERIAISRILSDIIKADNIIEEGEINRFNGLIKKYGIIQDDLIAAQRITFAEAVSILQHMELPTKYRKEILEDMHGMSEADGTCVAREALLLMTLKYCLSDELSDCTKIYSCDTKGTNISDLYIVYVESQEDEDFNKELMDKKTFRGIVNELKLNGFDFIYIPKLVEEFQAMGREHVVNVIKYIEPEQEKKGEEIYDKLCNITTDTFCRDLLADSDRLAMKGLFDTDPALLINIGTSVVPYCNERGERRIYTEFLKIDVIDSVQETIHNFIEEYQKLVFNPIPKPVKTQGNTFKYFGFYRALFDLMVTMPKITSRLVVDTKGRKLIFPDANNREIKLTPKRMALYLLILNESINRGGLQAHPTKSMRQKLDERYKDIRNELMLDEKADYEASLLSDRSMIEASITKGGGNINHIDLYIPVKLRDEGIFKIRVNPELVFIKDWKTGEFKPFKENGFIK